MLRFFKNMIASKETKERDTAEILRAFDVESYPLDIHLNRGIANLQKELNSALEQGKYWKDPYDQLVSLLQGAYEGEGDVIDVIVKTETPKKESQELLKVYCEHSEKEQVDWLLGCLPALDFLHQDLQNFKDSFENIHQSDLFLPNQKAVITGFVYAYMAPRVGNYRGERQLVEDKATFISKFVDYVIRPGYLGNQKDSERMILDLVKNMLCFQIHLIELGPGTTVLLQNIRGSQDFDQIVQVLQKNKESRTIRF